MGFRLTLAVLIVLSEGIGLAADHGRNALFALALNDFDVNTRTLCVGKVVLLDVSSRTGLATSEVEAVTRLLLARSCNLSALPEGAWANYEGAALLGWFNGRSGYGLAT